MTTCRLCEMDPCEPAVDRAVTRIHAWFRAKVTASLEAPEAPIMRTGEPWPGEGAPPRPPEAKRPSGRSYGNLRTDVTAEAVLDLLRQGYTRADCAHMLKCSMKTVRNRSKGAGEKFAAEVSG